MARHALFSLIALCCAAALTSCDGGGDTRDVNHAPGAFDWTKFHHDPGIRELQEFITERRSWKHAEGRIDREREDWRQHLPPPPEIEFTEGRIYRWALITNVGEIQFHFLAGLAPRHTTNTMYLTLLGYYDGLTFHRGEKKHLILGGCPLGKGTGGPGYRLSKEIAPAARHDYPGGLGAIGDEAGQFYVTFRPRHDLDGKSTIFGEISNGKPTLKRFEELSPEKDGPPAELIVIEKAYIYVN